MLTGAEIVARQLVTPAVSTKIDDGVVPSYGPDPAGYTLTADVDWVHWTLKPLESIKFLTKERVTIPRDYIGLLFCKSTYARRGIILVTNTPVDGGYEGPLTIRLFNSGDEPVLLWGQGGFMQMVVSQATGLESPAYTGRWMGGERIGGS